MKRFTFRLAHVLRLREQEEELWKLKLGQAARRVEEIDQGIALTKVEENKSLADLSRPLTMYVAQHYILRMRKERERLQHERVGAEKKRLEVLADYTKARQKAEVLRKLREKHHDEWRLGMLKYEEAQADDMAGARLVLAGQQGR